MPEFAEGGIIGPADPNTVAAIFEGDDYFASRDDLRAKGLEGILTARVSASQRHRKKPIEIEAVQLSWANWNLLCDFITPDAMASPGRYITAAEASDTCGEPGPEYIAFDVRTVHGDVATVRHGDWVIPDAKPGTFYPCKPAVFAATYELVTSRTES